MKKLLLLAGLISTGFILASCKDATVTEDSNTSLKEFGEEPQVNESQLTKLSQEDMENQIFQMRIDLEGDDLEKSPYAKQYLKANDEIFDNYESVIIKNLYQNGENYSYSTVALDLNTGNVYGYYKRYTIENEKEKISVELETKAIRKEISEEDKPDYTFYTSIKLDHFQVLSGTREEELAGIGFITVPEYSYVTGEIYVKSDYNIYQENTLYLFSPTKVFDHDRSIPALVEGHCYPASKYNPSIPVDQMFVNGDRSTVLSKSERNGTYVTLTQNNLSTFRSYVNMNGSFVDKTKVEYSKEASMNFDFNKDLYKESSFPINPSSLFFNLGYYGNSILDTLHGNIDIVKEFFQLSE